jgi:hypothetical protein
MNEAHLELSAGFGCVVTGAAGVRGHGMILAPSEAPVELGTTSPAPEAVTPAR